MDPQPGARRSDAGALIMKAGNICIAAASIGGISIAAWALVARVNREIDEAFEFGDLPLLPEGLATARISRAGVAVEPRPRGFARHIAHDETGPSA